jgi:hypothetical protein
MVRLAALVLTWMVAASCTSVTSAASDENRPLDVSLIQLVATPERYDGKLVRAIGYVRLEFEHYAIYPHRSDDEVGIARNGIALSLSDELLRRRTEFDARYVLLVGIFDARKHGHLGAFNGQIGSIRRFEEWRRSR